MTSIQRKACLSLRSLAFGRASNYREFSKSMLHLADLPAWTQITLTSKQLNWLARAVQKFRRQIGNPNLLFWAQRVLAEASVLSATQEEPCPQ